MTDMKKYSYLTLFLIIFILTLPVAWYKLFLEELITYALEPEKTVYLEEYTSSRGYLAEIPEEEIPVDPPEDLPPEFITVDHGYWHDALFIGDSRMIGLAEYTDLGDAHVFAMNGLSTFTAFKKKNAMPSAQPYLMEMLEQNTYGKVYIMLGLNEMGSNYDTVKNKYLELINTVHNLQPDALIFLCGNMHVTAERSKGDKTFNNANIDRLNQFLMEVADKNDFFYIDVNEVYDDETGALDAELTYDGIHVRASHYQRWNDWLKTKAILLPGMEYTPAEKEADMSDEEAPIPEESDVSAEESPAEDTPANN